MKYIGLDTTITCSRLIQYRNTQRSTSPLEVVPVPIPVHVYVKNTMPTATERKHFVNNEQSAHHDNQAGQKKKPQKQKPNPPRSTDTDI